MDSYAYRSFEVVATIVLFIAAAILIVLQAHASIDGIIHPYHLQTPIHAIEEPIDA